MNFSAWTPMIGSTTSPIAANSSPNSARASPPSCAKSTRSSPAAWKNPSQRERRPLLLWGGRTFMFDIRPPSKNGGRPGRTMGSRIWVPHSRFPEGGSWGTLLRKLTTGNLVLLRGCWLSLFWPLLLAPVPEVVSHKYILTFGNYGGIMRREYSLPPRPLPPNPQHTYPLRQ